VSKIPVDDTPNNGTVNLIVGMDQSVSEPDDLARFLQLNFGMALPELVHGLANYSQLALNCAHRFDIGCKTPKRTRAFGEFLNQSYRR
jgi:hypothetical protein